MLFIYSIENSIPRELSSKKLISAHISGFQRDLSEMSGVNFRNQFPEDIPVTYLLGLDYPNTDDWMPQFSFYPCTNKNGITLKALRLPRELQKQGIGTYCVNWLKDFCRYFGFDYIVLGSVEQAKGFWIQMGFKPLDKSQYNEYL